MIDPIGGASRPCGVSLVRVGWWPNQSLQGTGAQGQFPEQWLATRPPTNSIVPSSATSVADQMTAVVSSLPL
jgi:hypothetical protein